MPTPRVFLVRHGETEWSSKELHTSSTNVPLTETGQRQVHATSQALVGEGRLIQPKNLLKMLLSPTSSSVPRFGSNCVLIPNSYTSPRLRAQQTVECLNLVADNSLPWDRTVQTTHQEPPPKNGRGDATVYVTDGLQEWDYGDYEGLTVAETREKRKVRGQDEAWSIWKDGCEGGEYVSSEPIGDSCRPHPLTCPSKVTRTGRNEA